MKITVEAVLLEDYDILQELVKEAFTSAEFSDGDEFNLIVRLRDSGSYIADLSLKAVVDGQIVGHIMFTKIKIGSHIGLALAPVSVLPAYQGKGIGKALIEKGHEIAEALGYPVSVVLGHERYYPKFGYKPAADFGILPPFDVPKANFMVKELKKDSLEAVTGTVAYDKAFFER